MNSFDTLAFEYKRMRELFFNWQGTADIRKSTIVYLILTGHMVYFTGIQILLSGHSRDRHPLVEVQQPASVSDISRCHWYCRPNIAIKMDWSDGIRPVQCWPSWLTVHRGSIRRWCDTADHRAFFQQPVHHPTSVSVGHLLDPVSVQYTRRTDLWARTVIGPMCQRRQHVQAH